jgi:tetratricopeptide (TPR) repeat protein
VLQQRTQLDLEGAIASYRRAMELNPEDVQAYRKLLEIQPDNWEVCLQLGKLLIKLEQWEEAISCFRQSCELEPNSFLSHYQLGIALSQLTEKPINSLKPAPETVKILLETLQANNISASLSELNDVAFCRATEHLKDESFVKEAYRVYMGREAESGAPEGWSQQIRQGYLTRLSFLTGIRRSAEFKAKTNSISLEEAQEMQIALHWRALEIFYENLAEEIACYRQALELDRTSSECQYYLSKALRKNHLLSESEAFFKKAVHQGILLSQENRIEEALNIYQKGLEIIPENRTYLLPLALILVQLGHIDSLLNCYKHTLKLSTDIIRASHELGIFLAEQGLLNNALICFQNTPQIPCSTKWGIYEKIWDDLNEINPSTSSNCNYPTDINPQDVAECFATTSRYKVMTVGNMSEAEQKYMEEVGISLAYIELMGQDRFALEKICINSFSDTPRELLGERLNLTPPSYQQSLVETGYFYSFCPFSGKILRSDQSFVINHQENPQKQRGHDLQGFCYRFLGEQVFYIMTGCPNGERLLVYLPKIDIIINLFPNLVGVARAVESINKLKSYIVSSWKEVKLYIATTEKKKVVDVIGLGFNLAHYVWQDLAGMDVLRENGLLPKLDKIIRGPGEYWSSRDIFPEIPADKFIEVEDVRAVFQKVIEKNYVALRVNGIFIKEQLIKRIGQTALQKCSREFLTHLKQVRQHYPVLCVQIRSSGRVWLSQVTGIANIINQLFLDYPNLAVVFDGWSVTGKEDSSNSCWSTISREKEVMNQIIASINPNIPTHSAIASTIFETSAWWIEAIDMHISPIGSGLTYASWIANKPGVVHGPIETYWNKPLFAQSLHRENLLPQLFIPEKYIIAKGGGSYDCDWTVIYDEVTKILPEPRKKEIYSHLQEST